MVIDTTSRRGTTGRSSGSSSGGSGAAGGALIIIAAVVWLLFSLGIINPTYTFSIKETTIPSDQYQSCSLYSIRMDDGSNVYPKNFNRYTAESGEFSQRGKSSIDLKEGSHDIWVSYDGVSSFSTRVEVNNPFDEDVSLSFGNVNDSHFYVVRLFLQDSSEEGIITNSLIVRGEDGGSVPTTAYKDAGNYIVKLPASQVSGNTASLTVQATGFQITTLVLDFSEGRVVSENVTLTRK